MPTPTSSGSPQGSEPTPAAPNGEARAHMALTPAEFLPILSAERRSAAAPPTTELLDQYRRERMRPMSSAEVIARLLGAGLAGYLVGSLPSGVIVSRIVGNDDPRVHGSGKTGATNVLRTVGVGPAVAVALFDLAKGVAAILVARYVLFPSNAGLATNVDVRGFAEALAGFAAILGHNRSIFIRFTGGRGVLTGAGIMLAVSPAAMLIAVIAGIVPIMFTRYVSLGSVMGAFTGGLVGLIFWLTGHLSFPHGLILVVGATVIIASHRDNIERLLSGTERKLGHQAG